MTMLLFMLAVSVTAASAQTQATNPATPANIAPTPVQTDTRIVFPASVSQGALVFGKVPPGSKVGYAGRELRVSSYGTVALGVGRDEKGPLQIEIKRPDGIRDAAQIMVTARDWPLEHVNGVPPKTVNPPPDIAARIKREQALVVAARGRDDDRTDFAQAFIWPVQGRISGRFGNSASTTGSRDPGIREWTSRCRPAPRSRRLRPAW